MANEEESASLFSFVYFGGATKNEFSCLTNFAPVPLSLEGRDFLTGEHAFHFYKFTTVASEKACEEARAEALRKHAELFVGEQTPLRSASMAKTAGGKSAKGFQLTPAEQAIWSRHAEKVQRSICCAKLGSSANVRAALAKARALRVLLIHFAGRKSENELQRSEVWGGRVAKSTIVSPAGRAVRNCGSAGDKSAPVQRGRTLLGQNRLGALWNELAQALPS